MSATVSVEVLIANRFDKFYDECVFQGIELSWEFKQMLDQLEGDITDFAKDLSTTEAKNIYDKGYDDGYQAAEEDYC
jgi:hypothetical protein